MTYHRPNYARTSRAPVVVDGVTFESWQTGTLRYALMSQDGRGMVQPSRIGATYAAGVDGETIGPRYATEDAALKAACKALRLAGTAPQ